MNQTKRSAPLQMLSFLVFESPRGIRKDLEPIWKSESMRMDELPLQTHP